LSALILAPPALLCLLGFAAAAAGRRPRLVEALGSWGGTAGNLLGLAGVVAALALGKPCTTSLPWLGEIGGAFRVDLDPLSGFFLLPVYGIGAVSALYGGGYLRRAARRLGSAWLFYHLLGASMVLVVLARNAVLFLLAWEVMTISSWFLVTFEDEQPGVRRAGLTYLAASQIGTAFLMALFLLLGKGELDFARFGGLSRAAAGCAFMLALIGFGTKAGIVPLHVWLPEAHPAAPSHVSALMSGVMIKLGIYGILRTLTYLGAPAAWWGWTLLAVGAVSGVLGVLFALAQHDLKRLLAYHSVENIGIILLGVGLGLLGLAYGLRPVAVLGFGGGLLHVANHALFKSLLFLGAGAAAQAAGTRDLEQLGGLARRMPLTGLSFLLGAAAISALPPLNGFVSEFLIGTGALRAVLAPGAVPAAAGAAAIVALALIGGLAAACFAKAYGIAFLGEPRSPQAAAAREARPTMILPMLVLAAACLTVGLLGPLLLGFLAPLVAQLTGLPPRQALDLLGPARRPLGSLVAGAGILAGLAAALAGLRALLLSRRRIERGLTWDCGYLRPGPRLQYTASSFAQPLLAMFRRVLSPQHRSQRPSGYFPREAHFASETPDAFERRLIRPAFASVARLFARMRWLQQGRLRLYVLYIALTLLALLVWKLGGRP